MNRSFLYEIYYYRKGSVRKCCVSFWKAEWAIHYSFNVLMETGVEWAKVFKSFKCATNNYSCGFCIYSAVKNENDINVEFENTSNEQIQTYLCSLAGNDMQDANGAV